MGRLARVVVPGVAHHITQRGNRRQQTFFQEEDCRAYLALLERVKDWRQYLRAALEAEEAPLWRRHERTGRPLGEPAFLARIERLLGRTVRPAKRVPKPKRPEN